MLCVALCCDTVMMINGLVRDIVGFIAKKDSEKSYHTQHTKNSMFSLQLGVITFSCRVEGVTMTRCR